MRATIDKLLKEAERSSPSKLVVLALSGLKCVVLSQARNTYRVKVISSGKDCDRIIQGAAEFQFITNKHVIHVQKYNTCSLVYTGPEEAFVGTLIKMLRSAGVLRKGSPVKCHLASRTLVHESKTSLYFKNTSHESPGNQ